MLSFSKTYKPVVYLSAEFAIDSELPTYAGGLGVLAGDIIKQAADEDREMIGIGILYKGKHFIQHITREGKEEKRDSQFDHDASFLRPTTNSSGKPLIITLEVPGNTILIKSYHIRLSDNTVLIFLSTDVDGNPQEWRDDVNALYSGDQNSQIRQQIILGIGGYKIVQALKLKPIKYHFNEGRPIFLFWELVQSLCVKGRSFDAAVDEASNSVVYTNHTLVDAANLKFPLDLVKPYAVPYADFAHVSVDDYLQRGNDNGVFSITKYALAVSSKHSAVSKLHCKLASEKWSDKKWNCVTNGIHMPTWQDSDFRKSHLTDEDIWNLHMSKKVELERSVVERTGFGYDPQRLVITWARRLAEYKQPFALFTDIARLKALVSNPGKEIQILYAGNAHGHDERIKSIIEKIIEIASNELSGHVIFIPNYNISLANHLVSGSDIWLNTPQYGLEASGTSGMKALSNGVLNMTVADGWAQEVSWNEMGWELQPENIPDQVYSLLEQEVCPMYYERSNVIPTEWVKKMRLSIETSRNFSTERVLEEYYKYLYK